MPGRSWLVAIDDAEEVQPETASQPQPIPDLGKRRHDAVKSEFAFLRN
jgi:hypothetical protein